MQRTRWLAASLVTTLVLAGIVVSCSDASGPGQGAPSDDPGGLYAGALAGGGWTPAVEKAVKAMKAGKIDICHSGNDEKFTSINVSTNAIRAHLGDPETGLGGHIGDYRVSELTPCPPPVEPGLVQVCNVAGNGVATGTNFDYVVTVREEETPLTVAAGAAPTGTCVAAGSFRVGMEVTIQQTTDEDVEVTGLTVTPAGAQVGMSDLEDRVATVVVGVGTTTVTFANTSTVAGSFVLCKIAGIGVTSGTNFTFHAAGQTATVAAGAAPTGTCSPPMIAQAGNVTVTEDAAAGVAVTAMTATGEGGASVLVNSDLATRSATFTMGAGKLATVTFTNGSTTSGALVVCKVAGTGVAAGANFAFTAGAQNVTVAAGAAPNGTCSSPISLAAGAVTVTEAAVAGTSVSAITGTPAPGNVNLAGRSATTQITAGQQSTITFTNVVP